MRNIDIYKDNDEAFRLAAIKPTMIAIVLYALIKQFFFTISVEGNGWIYRLIISIIWISIVFVTPRIKKLTRRQITLIILIVSVLQETVFYASVGGDRLVFMFLIGCSLLSVMYADTKAMIITMTVSCVSISLCVFVLGINTVGLEYEVMDDVYNVAGLVMLSIVIFLIGKYTIETLAKARQKAEASDRAKSNFLATMSHEIRTPMNAIIGIAQIQLQKDDLPEEYARALERIYASGNNLLGIINDILDMSKIETGRLELNPVEYDMPSMINDTVQINIVRVGSKEIEFKLELDENLPIKMFGDELRLKQILNNLLSNAIKYTDKGYVKLSVGHTVDGDDIWLRFVVEDSGQGLKPEDKQRLFSEYTRFNADANRTVEGTGIGLSITKTLVSMMEGTIEFDSQYGKGSIFTVTVKQKAVECPIIGPELAEQLRSFTFTDNRKYELMNIPREQMPYGKVLVVDDVDTNLYVAKGLMSPYKLNIETADSGLKAIDKVKNGNTYDVIFMDHMMPQMDGIETTQKLREMGYSGAIVALTANALAGNDDIFAGKGFDDFISKPINVRYLDTALNKYVRDRHMEERRKHISDTPVHKEGEHTEVHHDDIATLKNIDGLDIDSALAAMGGMSDVYIKTLRLMAKSLPETIKKMDETIAWEDMTEFTVEIHGLKGVLQSIGASVAGNRAAGLEEAAKEGRLNISDYFDFKTSLEELLKQINTAMLIETKSAEYSHVMVSAKELKKAKTAIEDFDSILALDILSPYINATGGSEIGKLLEEVINALEAFDCEFALERIGKLEELVHE